MEPTSHVRNPKYLARNFILLKCMYLHGKMKGRYKQYTTQKEINKKVDALIRKEVLKQKNRALVVQDPKLS